MNLLVCGGRDYTDRAKINDTLWNINSQRGPIIGLIHGNARGADKLAGEWQLARIRREQADCAARRKTPARASRLPHGYYHPILWMAAYPAQWALYGNAAGPIRNKFMLDRERVDLVVAFRGGRGTAHMVALARSRGIEVLEIK